MEKYYDNIKETISSKAILVERIDVENTLKHIGSSLRKIKRIPSVIDSQKKYKTFSVLNSHPPSNASIYILIDDLAKTFTDNYTTIHLQLNIDYFTHTEILQKIIPQECNVSAFEVIGDIIHLNLTDSQVQYKDIIGAVLHYKTGLTVINKTGKIDNTFRYYEADVLAGKNKLTTTHVENGIKVYIDLGKVYWCSRLQTERMRIVEQIKPGNVVCDPFCGVGALVLHAINKGAVVFANDLNPDAISCLKTSLKYNKLSCDNIFCSDAALYLRNLAGRRIDRFVFNLPEYSLDYIKYLTDFEKFYLHCFFFFKDSDGDIIDFVASKTGYNVRLEWLRKVRKVSPSKAVYMLEVYSEELFNRS